MHRDYHYDAAHVFVSIFADRLEVENPGGLFSGLSLADLGKRSVRRNRLVADLLFRARYVERVGSGIPRIRQALQENGNPPMEISVSNFFVVTFRPRLDTESPRSARQSPAVSIRRRTHAHHQGRGGYLPGRLRRHGAARTPSATECRARGARRCRQSGLLPARRAPPRVIDTIDTQPLPWARSLHPPHPRQSALLRHPPGLGFPLGLADAGYPDQSYLRERLRRGGAGRRLPHAEDTVAPDPPT